MKKYTNLNQNFLYFPRIFITMLSSGLFSFSSGVYILETNKQSITFATNLLLFFLPVIVISPFWGVLCDRISKKFLSASSSLLSSLLMLILFLLWDKTDNLTLIYMGSFFSGLFSGLVYLTFEAGLPQMFENRWLVQANSLAQTMTALGKISAPLLGGFIYSFIDLKSFILINALIYAVAFILDLGLKIDESVESRKNVTNFKESLKFFSKNPEIKDYTLGFILVNTGIFMIVLVPVPYLIKNIFMLEYSKYGLILSLANVGAIIGAILTTKLGLVLNNKLLRNQYLSFILIGACVYFPMIYNMNSSGIATLYILVMLFSGMVLGILDITSSLYFQRNIPVHQRGQIIGVVTSIAKLSIPFSLIISGKLVDQFSSGASILLGASFMGLAVIHSKIKEKKELKEFVI